MPFSPSESLQEPKINKAIPPITNRRATTGPHEDGYLRQFGLVDISRVLWFLGVKIFGITASDYGVFGILF